MGGYLAGCSMKQSVDVAPSPWRQLVTGQPEPLSVQFDRSGHNLTVYLAGQLDASNAPELKRRLLDRVDRSIDEIWLDLSTLTFCDASGLEVFEVLHHHISAVDGRVVLYQPQGEVDRLLAVSGLDQLIHVIGRKRAATKIG